MGLKAKRSQNIASHYSQEGVKQQVARQKGLVPTTARGSLEWVSPSTATALREASSTRAKTAQLGLPFEIPQTEAEQKMFREAVYSESSRQARQRVLEKLPTARQVEVLGSQFTGQELIKFAQNISPNVQLTIHEDFKTPQQEYSFDPTGKATTFIGGRKYTSGGTFIPQPEYKFSTEEAITNIGRNIFTSEPKTIPTSKQWAGSIIDWLNKYFAPATPQGLGFDIGITGAAKAQDIPVQPSLGGMFTGTTSPSQVLNLGFGEIGESFANAFSGLGKTLLIGGLIIAGAYVLGKGISK